MCCRVSKCFCCIGLRVGIIALSSLWLLVDALVLVWTAYMTYAMNAVVAELRSKGYEGLSMDIRNWQQADAVFSAAVWIYAVGAVLTGTAVLLDIMLLAGAINARRKLLHGWIVAYAVLYAVALLICALAIVIIFLGNNASFALILTAAIIVHAGLMVYFWIVVRSYYLELGQQYGEGGPRSTAGKVYCTVPTGDVLPAQGSYCYADGMAMAPAAPPRYTSSA